MQRSFLPDVHTEANARSRAGEEAKMNLLKNVEVVLLLGFGVLCALAWSGHAPGTAIPGGSGARMQPEMMVIVITGKRLSAAEKRAFDAQARSG